MRLVQVKDGQIIQTKLPSVGVLKNGQTVSGYNKLPEDILKQEGWLPLIEEYPSFDSSTQTVEFTGYDVQADKVVAVYTIKDIEGIHLTPKQLQELKQAKIAAIKQKCQEVIEYGFDSTAKGGILRHYTYRQTDQLNMKSLAAAIQSGAQKVPWHYAGQTICEPWTAAEFMQLYKEGELFVLQTRFYCDGLEEMIIQAQTVAEVNAIEWGTQLTPAVQNRINGVLAEVLPV